MMAMTEPVSLLLPKLPYFCFLRFMPTICGSAPIESFVSVSANKYRCLKGISVTPTGILLLFGRFWRENKAIGEETNKPSESEL